AVARHAGVNSASSASRSRLSPLSVTPSSGALDPEMATYDGAIIDLSKSWDGAKACIVPAHSSAECFATQAAAQAAAAAISQAEISATSGGSTGASARRPSTAAVRSELKGATA